MQGRFRDAYEDAGYITAWGPLATTRYFDGPHYRLPGYQKPLVTLHP